MLGSWREVSTRNAWVAAEGAGGELVSAANSLIFRKKQGTLRGSGPAHRWSAKIPESIRTISDGFPATRNREFVHANRESIPTSREIRLSNLGSLAGR
jgi:hypothetical protein